MSALPALRRIALRWHRRVAIVLSAAALLASPSAAQPSENVVPEARVTVIAGSVTSTAAGGAISLGRVGYTRFALQGGYGVSWRDRRSREAAHADAVIRFFLDPYRTSRWGVYGTGGLSAVYDGFTDWRALILVGAGVEFPSKGRASWAVEAGLGGGLRIALALRHAPERHR